MTSVQEMPCTPVTAPMATPSASSTGPCSMCSSTNAWGTAPGHGARSAVADAVELVADDRAVDADDVERLLQRHTADVHEAAEHVGREPGTLLVGEEAQRRAVGRARRRHASGSRSPRARRARRGCRRSGRRCATVSMCEPVITGATDRRPGIVATTLPMPSMATSRPRSRIQATTRSRPAGRRR